ncbi:hypothetical protein VU04_04095, partial [Desulfobulbus sp. TB]|nr:hypothetical protein [Desulfobulbus sp. TB]
MTLSIKNTENPQSGILTVVGTGPGAEDLITPRAQQALTQAQVVVGYTTYLELIRHCLSPEQEILSSAMMQEIDRCRRALELADKRQKGRLGLRR